MTELLSKDHSILEKPVMEFRPFGVTSNGEKIRDVSGVTVRANVEYLEDYVGQSQGSEAGKQAVEKLCKLLNERIADSAYHVDPPFLKNIWHSYSYEFVCYLGEFCRIISDDPCFQFNVGQEKFLPDLIQVLARPLSLPQIYKMFPHFGDKFAKGSAHFTVVNVTARSAILRMKFTKQVYEQFGSYRARCAELICQSAKAGLAAVPAKVHDGKPARIIEHTCIANGDDSCEWEFRWIPKAHTPWLWILISLFTGGAALTYLRFFHPEMSLTENALVALFPAALVWLFKVSTSRNQLIKEQLASAEERHEELREAFVEQEQVTVELRQKVRDLTTLHHVGLLLNSTLDRDHLIDDALNALLHELHYDRAMISFFDRDRQVSGNARILGVSDEVKAFVRSIEIPVTDPQSIEGMVQLREIPMLVQDVRTVLDRLHPLTQQLVAVTQAKSFISVPLKAKHMVIGALTVDRTQSHTLNQGDVDVIATVASQLATALDNAEAYRQIEALNTGLENKVRERTAQLEEAHRKVQIQASQLEEWNQSLENRVETQVAQLERLGKLKRFFSPQLAELIVTGGTKDPLKSHRQDISVVFLDLRGYSSFAETVRPDELMDLLQEYHAEMGQLVMDHNGTLERFTGDGMMIFFNDPLPISNPNEQAVRMALAMRHRGTILINKWDHRNYNLGFGIGIASGPATIGAIGFEGRWDYAAIGPVTNLASRLCSEAQSGQILVSRQFFLTLDQTVEAELVGELCLKGFGSPITTYNLQGLRASSETPPLKARSQGT